MSNSIGIGMGVDMIILFQCVYKFYGCCVHLSNASEIIDEHATPCRAGQYHT